MSTPQYYVIRANGLTPYTDPEEARKVAENFAKGLGEDVAIVTPVSITKISVTTTWLGKQDIGGACEQTTSYPTTPVDGWTPPVDPMLSSTGWSWPILPPGHSYLNPENLTVEQLGDCWRLLCTLDERFPEDHELFTKSAGWIIGLPHSMPPRDSGASNLRTYRTRAPIPTQQ